MLECYQRAVTADGRPAQLLAFVDPDRYGPNLVLAIGVEDPEYPEDADFDVWAVILDPANARVLVDEDLPSLIDVTTRGRAAYWCRSASWTDPELSGMRYPDPCAVMLSAGDPHFPGLAGIGFTNLGHQNWPAEVAQIREVGVDPDVLGEFRHEIEDMLQRLAQTGV